MDVHRLAECSHAELIEVCEERDTPMLSSVMEGDLHSTEAVIVPAADASQHVVRQPPLPAITCTTNMYMAAMHGSPLRSCYSFCLAVSTII